MKYSEDVDSLLFSFLYDGRNFAEMLPETRKSVLKSGTDYVTEYEITYAFQDGLEIVQSLKEYPEYDACEWVLHFYNGSDKASGIISELNDCDVSLLFEYDAPSKPGFILKDGNTKIVSATGPAYLSAIRDEFLPKEQFILSGQVKKYAPTGGRSSQATIPFFDVNQGNKGVICAVGWTGQWHAVFTRSDEAVNIKTGVEGVTFRLLPGEKIRTSSVVLMDYKSGQNNGHNQFRRLVKQHFSLIGKSGRPKDGPLCTMSWGAVPTDIMLRRIGKIAENKLGFEYYWIDAGWYGSADGYSPSEHEGDWSLQTGNWEVNKKSHPDGLLDVAKAVKKNNMRFLLWIEPERANSANPMPMEHPDWFFKLSGNTSENQLWLLNFGNPDALNGITELVSGLIEKLGLDCYRQDFNISPLPYWSQNDEPERTGINQIKHIMGLYEFWDTLLERFPNLIIDNCAGGGQRIDIETLRRSIPLWRSDCQCIWDRDPEFAQTHNTGISWWIPYSGTGTGCVMGDIYRIRSCYSAALSTCYWGYEDWDITNDQPFDWVRKSNSEYKKARPYFSCDYYPLTPPSIDDGSWTAWQYDRPERHDGIVMAFRRPESPCETARFELGSLKPGRLYRFEDADTGEIIEAFSDELIKNGFKVTLAEKRSSKLYFYTVK